MSADHIFQSYSELISHCLDLGSNGKAVEACSILSDYITENIENQEKDAMWGGYYLLEAITMRIYLSEDKVSAALSGIKLLQGIHSSISRHLAEANSVLAAEFADSDQRKALEYARESLRFAALSGQLPKRLIQVLDSCVGKGI